MISLSSRSAAQASKKAIKTYKNYWMLTDNSTWPVILISQPHWNTEDLEHIIQIYHFLYQYNIPLANLYLHCAWSISLQVLRSVIFSDSASCFMDLSEWLGEVILDRFEVLLIVIILIGNVSELELYVQIMDWETRVWVWNQFIVIWYYIKGKKKGDYV